MIKKYFKDLVYGFMKKRSEAATIIDSKIILLHKAFENLDYNIYTNGECETLRKLANNISDINTILDVGANIGMWSQDASKLFPGANIHAFEIVPKTFQLLETNCNNTKNIYCYNYGLSDTNCCVEVNYSDHNSAIATCVNNFYEEFHHHSCEVVKSKVITGDDFCAANKIDSIDYLKIDVEGLEHKVLHGFNKMLDREKIRIIQFEYGFINVITHYLLKDFYSYLEQRDMVVGKIYPAHVDFKKYEYSDENFYGPNYLAVHKSCKNIINLLLNK